MVPSQSEQNLEDLYKCPWFFGELTEENAKEILKEAKQSNNNSESKTIIFLKSSFDDIKRITLPLSLDIYRNMILMASLNSIYMETIISLTLMIWL